VERRTLRRFLRIAVVLLCAIAVAASLRRLIVLDRPPDGGFPAGAALDLAFNAKAALTRAHVIPGLLLALLLPVQFSSTVRGRWPGVHRWLGRGLMITGLCVGLTGYPMVIDPVGGALEVSAILVYATAFLAALTVACVEIRRGNVARHREWMIRAMAIVLGIATTRPIIGVFFATAAATGLTPAEFFGPAFWIGFTATAMAGEWYVRTSQPRSGPPEGGPTTVVPRTSV